jgi:hypothetical protein
VLKEASIELKKFAEQIEWKPIAGVAAVFGIGLLLAYLFNRKKNDEEKDED